MLPGDQCLIVTGEHCELEGGEFIGEGTECHEGACALGHCEGDANGDGVIDPLDVGFILARFDCDVDSDDEDCISADQNGDGMIDPLDIGFVLARMGECEP